MKLRLERTWPFEARLLNNEGVFSRLFIDDVFECYVLEDKEREEKILGKTAIPLGTYRIEFTYSNKFDRILPELMDVSGFTGVRIHSGNYVTDTDGCILVGKSYNLAKAMLLDSKEALHSLLIKMINAYRSKEITIEIVRKYE